MFRYPEQYRMPEYSRQGEPGAFLLKSRDGRQALAIIAASAEGWEHVSVHKIIDGEDWTPSWEEMCMVKGLFWEEEDCVVQYHPPKSTYVNVHPHTLHLWRPAGTNLPTPPKNLIG